MEYRTFQSKSQACPVCSHLLDAVTGPAAGPSAGDITICAYCATPLLFDENLELALPDAETFKEIMNTPGVQATIDLINKAWPKTRH